MRIFYHKDAEFYLFRMCGETSKIEREREREKVFELVEAKVKWRSRGE